MAKKLEPGRGPQLSQQELDLIERFQTAYNTIDRYLRKVLRGSPETFKRPRHSEIRTERKGQVFGA